jgi:hypothetical protein
MPSLRDVAHGGVLCTIRNIDQTQTGVRGVVRQGRRHGPSITYKITPYWVTLIQSARRAAVLAGPLAFGLIGEDRGEENSVVVVGKETASTGGEIRS